jgi:hypothetical protein
MAQPISNLSAGAKVKYGKLYNNPIIWKIADKNHSGYPSGAITLVTEKIIKIMAHDGKEASNSDANRRSAGNNRYLYANIRQWLNKDSAAGAWYVAQHGADASPTTANCSGYNGYDTLAGFLNQFTAQEKGALLNTTLTVGKATVDGGGTETVVDKVFLLSGTEVGLSTDFTEGTKLALFSDNTSRIAAVTADAYANSNYQGMGQGGNWYYWLRTPYAAYSYHVRGVNTDGTLNGSGAYYGGHVLRPACNLSSSLLVSDSTDGDGCYTLIYNEPPTVPGTITVPGTAYDSGSIEVSWTASTDPEGTAVSYKLERLINGTGSWTQVYAGAATSYNDTPSSTWNNVQYRVKAIDSDNVASAYKTSSSVTISHNQAPSTPTSITVPTVAVLEGSTIGISWTESTDPESQAITYKLERKADSGAWTEISSQTGRNHNDTAGNWDAVQYRVKAVDSVGAASGYATSTTVTITHNRAPSVPDGITVNPSTIIQGGNITVSWGVSTDPEGEDVTYILERSTNSGANWEQIYSGPNRTYQEIVSWASLQYRVKAADPEDIASGYVSTGSTGVVVIPNTPPSISGTDRDLGEFTNSFTPTTYVVSDADSDVVTVTEKLDGMTLRIFETTLDATNSLGFTAAAWKSILNGNHTLTITATDTKGTTATRTLTFSKNVTSLRVSMGEPVPADEQPIVAIVNVQRQFPSGSTLAVEICNNGFDDAPTWENCTSAVQNGTRIYFTNTTKTSSQWGVNVRVSLARGTSTEPCYVESVGGNFA